MQSDAIRNAFEKPVWRLVAVIVVVGLVLTWLWQSDAMLKNQTECRFKLAESASNEPIWSSWTDNDFNCFLSEQRQRGSTERRPVTDKSTEESIRRQKIGNVLTFIAAFLAFGWFWVRKQV